MSIKGTSVLASQLVAEAGGLTSADELVDREVPIERAASGVRLAVRDGRLEHAVDELERPCLQLAVRVVG